MNASDPKPRSPLLTRRNSPEVDSVLATGSSDLKKTGRGLLVSTRMLLLVGLLALPLIASVALLVNQQQQQINFALSESDGATYLQNVGLLLNKIVLHRNQVVQQRAGLLQSAQERQKTVEAIAALFTTLDPLDKRFGAQLSSTETYQRLKSDWLKIAAEMSNRSVNANIEAHNALITGDLFGLVQQIAVNSKLVLDPELDTYQLMLMATRNLPQIINGVGDLASTGSSVLLSHKRSAQDAVQLAAKRAVLDSFLKDTQNAASLAAKTNPSLNPLSLQTTGFNSVADQRLGDIVDRSLIQQFQASYPVSSYLNILTTVSDNYNTLYVTTLERLKALLNNRVTSLQNAQRLILLGLLGLLALVGLGAFLITRAITRPLSEMSTVAQRFGSGDLNQIMPVHSQDEIGRLGTAFNESISRLREFLMQQEDERTKGQQLQQNIGDFLDVAMQISSGDLTQKGRVSEDVLGNVVDAINLMTEEVGHLLKDVQKATDQVNTGAQALTDSSRTIVQGAQSQAAIAQNTEQQIRNVSEEIQGMSNSAQETAQTALQTLEASKEGRQAVQETLSGMNAIRREVSNISKGVKSLSDRSLEIQEIVDTISGIAAQTNLLSLNAAIEASGAGEAGARFAIVADEVRKLAEDSAKSTERVAGLVKSIQTEIQGLVVGIEDGTKEVEQGYRIASQAGDRLEQISELAQKSAEFATRISEVTRVQVDRVQGVSEAVQSIAQTAQQAREQSQSGQASAEELRQLAQSLTANLERFKLPS